LEKEVKNQNNRIIATEDGQKKRAGKKTPFFSGPIWHEIVRYSELVIGAVIFGFGQVTFLVPAQLAPGGLNGFGIIINSATGFPVGLAYFLMNIPGFLWAFKLLGPRYLLRTGVAIAVSSATMDLCAMFIVPKLNIFPNGPDYVLASIFGGVLLGIGVGLIFRSGGSAGGTEVISQLLYWSTGYEYGKAVLVLDSVIIAIVTLYFRNIQLALYSIITLFIYSMVLNMVASGMTSTKLVIIITNECDKIRNVIMEKLGRGVTILDAEGGYRFDPKKMVICAVPQSQVSRIKEFVREVDQESFMMVSDLSEVVGKGFERKLPK